MDSLPLWVIVLTTLALLSLALEAGYRAGHWRHERTPDEREQPVGAMVAAILGLLALVLGFTFNFAASRFEARRRAVLEEANAIGTTYLRTSFLPREEQSSSQKLLQEYVTIRLQAVKDRKLEAAIVRSGEIQGLLWKEATSAGNASPQAETVGLYIAALNGLIDQHEVRLQVALRSRIPAELWFGLNSLAVMSFAAVGYMCGLSTTRRSPAMLVLTISFTIVLLMIADLDRGQEGLLRVSQDAMVNVQTMIAAGQP
ncbi:bestrophin-like domain [Anatilimnocola floriformis]|uniref:bestrophin-like domain n=1 Tax=Anatilimnocola floriformis TaxID=2948575 RepID=UPI0020C1BAC8|nr:hypothetical protein [Anatilimnocola floriformis]